MGGIVLPSHQEDLKEPTKDDWEASYFKILSLLKDESLKVARLEGWLKALVPYIERSGLYDDLIKEIFAYIKAMEAKE